MTASVSTSDDAQVAGAAARCRLCTANRNEHDDAHEQHALPLTAMQPKCSLISNSCWY